MKNTIADFGKTTGASPWINRTLICHTPLRRNHARKNVEYVIINKVQKFRVATNITQEDLAEKVGVTRQTIIAIEKGNYTPSVTLALKIAKYFRRHVEEIFKLD